MIAPICEHQAAIGSVANAPITWMTKESNGWM
jgi:hypothetical protein